MLANTTNTYTKKQKIQYQPKAAKKTNKKKTTIYQLLLLNTTSTAGQYQTYSACASLIHMQRPNTHATGAQQIRQILATQTPQLKKFIKNNKALAN